MGGEHAKPHPFSLASLSRAKRSTRSKALALARCQAANSSCNSGGTSAGASQRRISTWAPSGSGESGTMNPFLTVPRIAVSMINPFLGHIVTQAPTCGGEMRIHSSRLPSLRLALKLWRCGHLVVVRDLVDQVPEPFLDLRRLGVAAVFFHFRLDVLAQVFQLARRHIARLEVVAVEFRHQLRHGLLLDLDRLEV